MKEVVGLIALLCACSPQAASTANLRVRFSEETLRQRARSVETRIFERGCHEQAPIYTSIFAVNGEAEAPEAPPPLSPGVYGMWARAMDENCQWFAQGCVDVLLPLSNGAAVDIILEPLAEVAACPGSCSGPGNCAARDTQLVGYQNSPVLVALETTNGVRLTSPPQNGSVQFEAGMAVYTPAKDFVGTDTFTYGTGESTSITVTVTIASTVSCAALLATGGSRGNGIYTLDPDGADGASAFDAYCEMTYGGGGYTLVLKADGQSDVFSYDSEFWTSTQTYQPQAAALDSTEAKLESFHRMPFTELLIAFGIPGSSNVRYVRIPFAANNLREIFARTTMTSFPALGRRAWLESLPGASLQSNCNLEGFNLNNGYNRLRIGIVANNENDCGSFDSRLGIGGAGCADCGCEGLHKPTVGSNDAGCHQVPTFATLFVR